jgi:hypothetical protein
MPKISPRRISRSTPRTVSGHLHAEIPDAHGNILVCQGAGILPGIHQGVHFAPDHQLGNFQDIGVLDRLGSDQLAVPEHGDIIL